MTEKEAVLNIMKYRGMKYELLKEKLGYKTVSGITERLYGNKAMRVDTLLKFLDAFDCELVIHSKLKDGTEWVVDGESIKQAMGEQKPEGEAK